VEGGKQQFNLCVIELSFYIVEMSLLVVSWFSFYVLRVSDGIHFSVNLVEDDELWVYWRINSD
jgi:hypothetical protein